MLRRTANNKKRTTQRLSVFMPDPIGGIRGPACPSAVDPNRTLGGGLLERWSLAVEPFSGRSNPLQARLCQGNVVRSAQRHRPFQARSIEEQLLMACDRGVRDQDQIGVERERQNGPGSASCKLLGEARRGKAHVGGTAEQMRTPYQRIWRGFLTTAALDA